MVTYLMKMEQPFLHLKRENNMPYLECLPGESAGFEVPTFADGTDAEIAEALDKHYAGEIDLTEYWSVGDRRTIHLSQMAATGVSESHFDANGADYEFVIIGMNHDNLQTPINGKTKAVITVQQDRILYANTTDQTYSSSNRNPSYGFGYMNSTNTNVGGWKSCARRTWCNSVYFNALPSNIKSKVKTVQKLTSAGNQSSTIETDIYDDVFLLSEVEIFGTNSNSASGEGSKYPYFDTASNIYKKPVEGTYNSARWWERSPVVSSARGFCFIHRDGLANYSNASNTYGLAPAFCL